MKKYNTWNLEEEQSLSNIIKRLLFYAICLGFCGIIWILIIMFLSYAQKYGVL